MNLSASCSSRGGPACRIWPNAGDSRSFSGNPKFGWLNRLKHSARNCTRLDSSILKYLNSERSTSAIPGPAHYIAALIAELAGLRAGFSCRKGARLTHSLGVCGCPEFGSEIRSGRLE